MSYGRCWSRSLDFSVVLLRLTLGSKGSVRPCKNPKPLFGAFVVSEPVKIFKIYAKGWNLSAKPLVISYVSERWRAKGSTRGAECSPYCKLKKQACLPTSPPSRGLFHIWRLTRQGLIPKLHTT